MTPDQYKNLERKIVRWSHDRSDIVATIVIGSHARVSPPPDEYSDLDLILLSLDPSLYTVTSTWLHEIGDLWIAALNYIGAGDPEWLALFDGGIKADFLFILAEPGTPPTGVLDASPYQDVLDRGARVIYAREPEQLELAVSQDRIGNTRWPSRQLFDATVNSALFAAERLLKFAKRGELWRGRFAANAELRRHLLTLIEWHAQSLSETELDTWYDGRYIEQWADRRILNALRNLEFGLDPEDQNEAAANTLALLGRLATETATQLGYGFPTDGQAKTLEWLYQTSRSQPSDTDGS